MVNAWHDVSPGDKLPEEFNAIIETPKGSRNKYELDKESGLIKFDRALYSTFVYPTDYGFVPQSYWEDGDPLDVMVIVADPTVPGCLIKVRPVGVLHMIDSGEADDKIIAVPVKDPRFEHIKDLKDLGEHFQKEVSHFFEHYKDLQGKKVTANKWGSKAEALKTIKKGIQLYKEKFGK